MKKKLLFLLALAFVSNAFVVNANKAIQIKATSDGITLPSGVTNKLYADENYMIKGLKYIIQLRNSGDEDILVGDEGFSLTLIDWKSNTNFTELATYKFDEDLTTDYDTFEEFEIEWPDFSIDYLTTNSTESFSSYSHSYSNRKLYVRVDLTGAISQRPSSTFQIFVPFTDFNIVGKENTSTVTSSFLGFQEAGQPMETEFRIQNTGGKALNISEIEVPEGFSVTPSAPFSLPGLSQVPADSKDLFKTFTISFNPTKTGVYGGKFVFKCDDGVEKELSVSAVSKGDEYMEDFEAAPADDFASWLPAGWKKVKKEDGTESQWKIQTCYTNMTNNGGGTYALKQDGGRGEDPEDVISPKLKFEENEKMMIGVTHSGNYSGLAIYWSPDGKEWTGLANYGYTATSTSIDPDFAVTDKFGVQNSTNYKTIDMPAGEGYLKFKGLYAWIDNIYGGTLLVEDEILELTYTIDHDPITGLSDVTISWGKEQPAQLRMKAATSQPTSYKVTVNGEPAGESTGTSHTIRNLDLGSHSIEVTPMYGDVEGMTHVMAVSMPEENYSKLTIELQTTDNSIYNGDTIECKSANGDRSYNVTVQDGKAELPSLEKGSYILTLYHNDTALATKSVTVDGDQTVTLDNIPTSVSEIEGSSVSGALYNAAGIKISDQFNESDLNTLPCGLYIINGKKVLIK
ncbi:MAG: hypothetical protein K2K97_12915 [Muribaculaceae bacterium]|nr:hypothetical protein [Muribaculaceae bacterium]